MKLEAFHKKLIEFIDSKGSQAEAARFFGVSRPYINDLYHGRRDASDLILERMGYKKTIVKAVRIRRR